MPSGLPDGLEFHAGWWSGIAPGVGSTVLGDPGLGARSRITLAGTIGSDGEHGAERSYPTGVSG